MADIGARTYDWLHVVRRARLGRTTKGIAVIIASYADPDGTRVFPGIASLAVAAECDYKTAQNAVAALRRAGLLELVRRAGRRGDSDEYRLILAGDLLDRVVVLSPAQSEMAAEAMRRQRPRGNRTTERQPTPRADVVDNEPRREPSAADTSAHGTPQSTGTSAHPTTYVSPNDDPTPIDHTTTVTHVLPTTHLLDLEAEVTTARASPSRTCRHGNTTRRRRDGTPRCPHCRGATTHAEP